MKNQKTVLSLLGGTLLGFTLAFGLGAADKAADKQASPVKKEFSHLQVVSYPNGGTGFFDSATATIYVYDADLKNCYMTRQIATLGEPLVWP